MPIDQFLAWNFGELENEGLVMNFCEPMKTWPIFVSKC